MSVNPAPPDGEGLFPPPDGPQEKRRRRAGVVSPRRRRSGRQPSLFDAELAEPRPADLAGLLAGPGQVVRMGGTARVSVVVDAAWRAGALLAAFQARGLAGTRVPTADEHIGVRTAFCAALAPLAGQWLRGAATLPPPNLLLDGPSLRLWALAAGRRDTEGYQLGLTGPDLSGPDRDGAQRDTFAAIGRALRAAGFPAELVGPRSGGPAFRISGSRRLTILAELIGRPPRNAAPDAWPVPITREPDLPIPTTAKPHDTAPTPAEPGSSIPITAEAPGGPATTGSATPGPVRAEPGADGRGGGQPTVTGPATAELEGGGPGAVEPETERRSSQEPGPSGPVAAEARGRDVAGPRVSGRGAGTPGAAGPAIVERDGAGPVAARRKAGRQAAAGTGRSGPPAAEPEVPGPTRTEQKGAGGVAAEPGAAGAAIAGPEDDGPGGRKRKASSPDAEAGGTDPATGESGAPGRIAAGAGGTGPAAGESGGSGRAIPKKRASARSRRSPRAPKSPA